MENERNYPFEVRRFLTFHRYGMLATLSRSNDGFPFGSLVPYDIDDSGDIIVYVSLIAEHYKNLTADPRASLLAIDYFSGNDPQAGARATALCSFAPVNEADRQRIEHRYLERFPEAVNHEIAHNFIFLRGTPERIRWIGGFGDIAWVPGEAVSRAAIDPLARFAFGIVQHMNDDHFDAVQSIVRHAVIPREVRAPAFMCDITPEAAFFTLAGERITVPFRSRVESPEGARVAMIQLLNESRAARK